MFEWNKTKCTTIEFKLYKNQKFSTKIEIKVINTEKEVDECRLLEYNCTQLHFNKLIS